MAVSFGFDWEPYIDLLGSLYSDCASVTETTHEMSRRVGVALTVDQVRHALKRYHKALLEERELDRALHYAERDDAMRNDAIAGLSCKEIADKFRVDLMAVYRAVPRHLRPTRVAWSLDSILPLWIYRFPKQEEDLPAIGGFNIVELERGQCRWPIGRDSNSGHKFCGCNVLARTAYCTEHTKLALAKYAKPEQPSAVEAKAQKLATDNSAPIDRVVRAVERAA